MKKMGLNELRESYLSFFESKGHLRLDSFPLVPKGDNSLLLINSGMAPLKKYFMGIEQPPCKRVTTCQKCIRTPDIERVGKTSRHGTYFEMLGNFSFGDYFKEEAIAWAWEYVTQVLDLPKERLFISVYEEDDEAQQIWNRKIGVAADHIVRLGKADNFWEHGSGPCGPCSEIYFDRGPEHGCGSPTCAVGCDCDRYVEFWNLVFTQFDSDGNGHYERLKNPNIDTGMGLERLACIMQGVGNLFEVDTVQNIMGHISKIAGVTYRENEKTDISLRVMTDHIRSTVFMVGDGVIPSNEGRGYVLRRLLRRAARHGRLVGIERPFLYGVCDTVIQENRTAYPELVEKAEYIKKVILIEEERFSKTIDQGMELLSAELLRLSEKGESLLSGEVAFKLYDTFGFPLDLTMEICTEKQISVDEEQFASLMKEQKQKGRQAHLAAGGSSWSEEAALEMTSGATEFVGYQTLFTQATILEIFVGSEKVNQASEGEAALIILDKTPFYAESGGQVGDTGSLYSADFMAQVNNCKKDASGRIHHLVTVTKGTVSVLDSISAEVDKTKRQATMRNHTCAHLLQAALIEVLGNHVHQAGQQVDSDYLRFDFAHFAAPAGEELKQVEQKVNDKILEGMAVQIREMSLAEAREAGAMALFSEKYGDTVRVVRAGDYSMELCGGTHVDNTAKIGLFKIVSESSVAAGVRRIEAVTGTGVLSLVQEKDQLLEEAAKPFKLSNPSLLAAKAQATVQELREKEKEIERLMGQLSASKLDSVFDSAVPAGDLLVLSGEFAGVRTDGLRTMGDQIRDRAKNAVAVLTGSADGKHTLMVVCGEDAVKKGVHAGKLIKEITAITGGSGGGRPDSATGSLIDAEKLPDAIHSVIENLK